MHPELHCQRHKKTLCDHLGTAALRQKLPAWQCGSLSGSLLSSAGSSAALLGTAGPAQQRVLADTSACHAQWARCGVTIELLAWLLVQLLCLVCSLLYAPWTVLQPHLAAPFSGQQLSHICKQRLRQGVLQTPPHCSCAHAQGCSSSIFNHVHTPACQ